MEEESSRFFRHGGSVAGLALTAAEKTLVTKAMKYGKKAFLIKESYGDDVIILKSTDFGSWNDQPFTFDIGKRKLSDGRNENFVGLRYIINF